MPKPTKPEAPKPTELEPKEVQKQRKQQKEWIAARLKGLQKTAAAIKATTTDAITKTGETEE